MPAHPIANPSTRPCYSTHPGSDDERANGPGQRAYPGTRNERAYGGDERACPGTQHVLPTCTSASPAPTQDDHAVQQWKAASAYHECQAKRFTVEAQQNHANAHRALQAEAELRDANTDLVAKAARCNTVISGKTTLITKLQLQLKMQQDLVTATEISRVELQEKATSATEHTAMLQDRLATTEAQLQAVQEQLRMQNEEAQRELQAARDQLSKTEASCIRLMNEASQKHALRPKEATVSKAKSKASPKRKFKTDADRFESKTRASPKRKIKTDAELYYEAQMAHPTEYGENGAERQERDREIQKYYAGLLRKREKEAKKSVKAKKVKFVPSAEFQGARAGFVFKTGSHGVGYYAEPKTTATSSSQHSQSQTVFGTDSEADEDRAPSTPPNVEENRVENGKDEMEDLTSSLQSNAVSIEYADDFVSTFERPYELQQKESKAKRLQRLDNEHWDRYGKPHPQSAFQTGPSSPSASQSSSSSTSTKLRKKGSRKTVKKLKAPKRKVIPTPPSSVNSGCDSDDSSVMDLSC